MAEVVYNLSLNDFMTQKLKEAFAASEKLEHKMGELKEKASGVGEGMLKGLETLGIGFALFEGAEFFHKSIEAFHNMEQANAQLEAGLESTKGVAGMTMASLNEGVEKFTASTLYSRTQLKDMQAQLLTFPAITKDTFNQTSEAVLNMASRTHRGVNELAIMVGKAMQDPVKGIGAMKRVGVNFSDAQKEMVKTMVATGHAAQAQKFILAELSTEYAGSAKAAFNADPLAQYNKTMETVQLTVGKAGEELVTLMAPALIAVAKALKAGVEGLITFGHWLAENTIYLKAAGIAVGILAVGWLAVNGAMIISTVSASALTAVLWLLDAAASANPIGLLVIGIAALAAGLYLAYMKCAPLRAAISGIGAVLTSFVPVVKGFGEILLGALTLNPALVKKGFKDSLAGIHDIVNAGGITGIFSKAYNASMHDGAKVSTMAKLGEHEHHAGAAGAEGLAAKAAKGKKESVTGHKSYTINIKIENLVKDFRVQTTNLTEGASKAKDMVAAALMSAVNDSQLVAGN